MLKQRLKETKLFLQLNYTFKSIFVIFISFFSHIKMKTHQGPNISSELSEFYAFSVH